MAIKSAGSYHNFTGPW